MEKACCSVITCGKKASSQVSFPFPRDFDLCLSWVKSCGRPQYLEEFTYSGAQFFLDKMVCSRHFDSSCFVDLNCLSKGLHPEAVPTLNLSEPNATFIKQECEDIEDNQELEFQDETFKLEWDGAFDCNEQQINPSVGLLASLNECTNEATDYGLLRVKRNVELKSKKRNDCKKDRLYNLAVKAAIRKSMETEEQREERRRKDALRATFRRRLETEEQRTQRRLKDRIRTAERRKNETEIQRKIRKYNDAVRAALRRENETEEQRQQRRLADALRKAKKIKNETMEQREKRLQTERERVARYRMLMKLNAVKHVYVQVGDNTSTLENMNAFIYDSDSNSTSNSNNNVIKNVHIQEDVDCQKFPNIPFVDVNSVIFKNEEF